MHRQIAGKLTGRVTKWIVLAFWIIAVVVLGGFAGKLTEVQNNEASSWLPGNAESTLALEKLEPFQDPNAIPTTVVYEKSSGFTPEDLVTMKDQAAELQNMDDVEGKVIGPIPSEDGKAAQTTVTYNLGSEGWNLMPDIAKDIHKIAAIDGANVHIAGAGGQAVDSAEAFEGLDSTLLLAALLVVIILLLFTYRSPVLWILPIFSVIVSLASLPRADLLPRQVRRPHRQRPEPGDRVDPGHRRRHRLRPAARREIPGRAPPSRGSARGDGLRAAPRHPGPHRQCQHGHRRHALPDPRRDELHGRSRSGLRHRRRRDAARHDHPAAGAARHLRSLDVLAQAARLRLRRADQPRASGPGSAPTSSPGRAGLDRHLAPAGRRASSAC